jgi:hypothetical protein
MCPASLVRPILDGTKQLRHAFVLVTLFILLATVFSVDAQASLQFRFVAPDPAGRADGSDWANAASLNDLPRMAAELSQGGEILLRADSGPYLADDPIILGDRGRDGPLSIRGVDPTGQGARALFVEDERFPTRPKPQAPGDPSSRSTLVRTTSRSRISASRTWETGVSFFGEGWTISPSLM